MARKSLEVSYQVDLKSTRLPLVESAAASQHLRERAERLGLSREEIAEAAEQALWDEATGIEISPDMVDTLMRSPGDPMRTYAKRAILAAVVEVLSADRALVNRMMGGI